MMKKKKKEISTCDSQSNSIISEANDDVVIIVSVKELAEDLIMDIFSHLPTISLLRFKSVSKTWYSLISNPDFLRRKTANQFDKHPIITTTTASTTDILLKRRHYFCIPQFPRYLTLVPPPPPNDYDEPEAYYCFHENVLSPLLLQKLIDYRPEHRVYVRNPIMVIDSCNGLLLFRNDNMRSSVTSSPICRKYTLYVCNPITQNYIKLPTLYEEQEQVEREQGFKLHDYLSLNIVFDPSLSLTYKVVTWLTCTTTTEKEEEQKKKKHYRLYVYSSETRSWRLSVSTNKIPVDPEFIIKRGVLCNGVLYWTNECHLVTNVALCYDVEKDVLSTLKFPDIPPGYRHRIMLYFGDCGGRLRLIENYYTEQQYYTKQQHGDYGFPSIFDVMELDNNDDSWTVKYCVNFGNDQEGHYANLIGNRRSIVYGVRILDLYKTKTKKEAGDQHEIEEEEELLLRIDRFCIIPFNLSSNKFGKELRKGEINMSAEERLRGFDFTDILRYNTITLFPPSWSSKSISEEYKLW